MRDETDRHRRFMAAYRPCHDALTRYCSALAFERMDTEDLLQDVLLSAYRRFDDLADPAKLQHYLLRAARNRAVSLRRSRSRRAALTTAHADRLVAAGATPDQVADVHLLYRAIHRLPARQRDAVLLFEISGFSQSEVAALQGCTVAAVKMRLQRARRQLERLLNDGTAAPKTLSTLLTTAQTIAL